MFDGVRKKRGAKKRAPKRTSKPRRRRSAAQLAAAKRMKVCARWWTGEGNYQKYMKGCLKKEKST